MQFANGGASPSRGVIRFPPSFSIHFPHDSITFLDHDAVVPQCRVQMEAGFKEDVHMWASHMWASQC